MRSFITGLLLVCCGLANGQRQNFYFFGKVLDKETRAGIQAVNITFTGTPMGTTTNRKGEFSFFIDTIPVYMTVSHLGYETQRIYLDNTSSAMSILLSPLSQTLKEVEIKAVNEPEAFFKDTRYAVRDHEVADRKVYILVFRFRQSQSELICKSVAGDTVARSGVLPFKPARLHKDCLGNIHLLSHDSAYQVFLDNDVLRLIHPSDINRFRQVLADCVASTEDLLFFRKTSRDGMAVEFYYIDRHTRQKKALTTMEDKEKAKMLRRNPEDQYLLMRERMPDDFEQFVQWAYVRKILYKPNTSTLHRVFDYIIIFNTTDYTLELYSLTGDFLSKLKMPVNEADDGKWTAEIYVDEIDHEVYTSYLKNGQLTLYRINLNNGELKRVLSTIHTYPEKIRIHNHHLFYLFDVPGEGDNKHLFKQKV